MDDMVKKKLFLVSIYDFYQGLLTEKQQKYFEGYYFDDLSISELSEIYSVSRNAIFDQLKRIVSSLEKYENILMMHKQYKNRLELIDEMKKNCTDEKILSLIDKLEKVE